VELSVNPDREVKTAVNVGVLDAPAVMIVDGAQKLWYSGNRPMIVYDGSTIPAKALQIVNIGNGTIKEARLGFPTADSIGFVVDEGLASGPSVYTMSRGDKTGSTAKQNRRRMSLQAASSNTTLVSSIALPSGSLLSIFSDARVVVSTDVGVTTTATATALQGTFSTVAGCGLSEDNKTVMVFGSCPKGWCVAIVSATNPESASWLLFNQSNTALPSCTAAAFGCDRVSRCIMYSQTLYCVLRSSAGPVVASWNVSSVPRSSSPSSLVLSTPLSQLRDQTIYYSPFTYEVTAMAADISPFAQFVLVAMNTGSESSVILKVSLEETLVTGELRLSADNGYPSVVRGLWVDTESREMFAVTMNPLGIRLVSVNLFGIVQVAPDVIDSKGGTMVLIKGEGFNPSAGSSVVCSFGSGRNSEGILVDSTTILCNATAAQGVTSGCVVNNMNVQFRGRSTSTSNVAVVRPTSATLHTAVSDDGNGYSDASRARTIVITGYGFVSSTASLGVRSRWEIPMRQDSGLSRSFWRLCWTALL
jgi:hypothetical protein